MRRLAVVLLAGAAGCGPGSSGRAEVRLTVTDNFGARQVRQVVLPSRAGGQTVLDVLRERANVLIRTGARAPQAIEGLAARGPVAWSFFVNGVAPDTGAASTKAHGGERIWFDRHDQRAAPRIGAVVGSFPEPFIHGLNGERLPIRVECARPGSPACKQTVDRFTGLGVVAAPGRLRGSFTTHTLRVLVGVWPQLRVDDSAARLERGPGASGVFARPAPDGRSLALLDARARVSRVLGAGSGLVAATGGLEIAEPEGVRAPVWLLTGTDERGVLAAVRSFTERALRDHFALAVTTAGRAVPLPTPRP
jgi:uncharacterized protein DUF4430